RRAPSYAGGGRAGVRGDPRAHPSDRVEDPVEAAPPLAITEAPRLLGVVGPARIAPERLAGGARLRGGLALDEVDVAIGLALDVVVMQAALHRRPGLLHALLDEAQTLLGALPGHLLGLLGGPVDGRGAGHLAPQLPKVLVPLAPGLRPEHVSDGAP